MALMHATAIAIDEKGVLITGPSGSGKSDLALRFIDRGALLISDDQVDLTVSESGGILNASPPDTIAGLIEIRGVGLVKMAHAANIPLKLHVDLDVPTDIARLPEPQFTEFWGVKIPKIWLNAFEPSAPLKVEWALRGDCINID